LADSLAQAKLIDAEKARSQSMASALSAARPARIVARERVRGFSGYKVLMLVFVLTLPLVNPWVRGDGVGYYAYIHSLLIDHNLSFENEWRGANQSFIEFKLGQNGEIKPMFYTSTGHLDNHFSVGPSMLWAPLLAPVHVAM